MTKMSKVSSKLINRMLPNRKPNRSTENPPDKLNRRTPSAKPADSMIATAESAGILVECLSLVIPTEARIEATNAVHSGYVLVNRPMARPPKAIWARESPNKDCLLSTRNKPIIEHTEDIAIPAMSARCINPNSKISIEIMFAYIPFELSQFPL